MLRRFLTLLGRSRSPAAALDLPTVDREEVSHLFGRPGGLPRVDWAMADDWIGGRANDSAARDRLRRAIAAACLDELRDSLPQDHRRWRSEHVEGLAPLEGGIGPAMARTADRSFKTLRRDLRQVRGDGLMPPVAIVAVEPLESYIDFTDSYFPDEGAFATSGGLYLNDGDDTFPLIAVSAAARHGVEQTVAHELTHHALHGANLPLWVEEGFTQMMEERIVGHGGFRFDHELLERHREHWADVGLEPFLEGSAFISPEDDEQELAYHLAEWFIRTMLQDRATEFFAFSRACRTTNTASACREHLGAEPEALLANLIGLR